MMIDWNAGTKAKQTSFSLLFNRVKIKPRMNAEVPGLQYYERIILFLRDNYFCVPLLNLALSLTRTEHANVYLFERF